MLCIGSAILPRDRSENEDREHGSAGHAFVEKLNKLGDRSKALATVPEKYREAFALIHTSRLPVDPSLYASEVALAFDVVTGAGRELHRKGDRDYSMCTPTEIPGTADALAFIDADAVYIGDYKFGRKWLPSPELNWQFRSLGLMAARAYGKTRAIVEMIRISPDGTPFKIGGELHAFDLADIAEELRVLHANGSRAAASDMPAPVVVGEHCGGCDSIRYCDAARAMTREVAAGTSQLVGLAANISSQEQALIAYRQLPLLRELVEKLSEELTSYGLTYPFTLEDGSRFGPVETSRSHPNGTAVWQMLARDYDEKTAWEAVELTAKWDALEAVARGAAERANKGKERGDKRVTIKGIYEGMRQELFDNEAAHKAATGKKGAFVKWTTYTTVKLTPPPKVKALPAKKAG